MDAFCGEIFEQRYKVHESLAGIGLKMVTREALAYIVDRQHKADEVREVVVHLDGGGCRNIDGKSTPATWAVTVCTVGHDSSYSFACFFGGAVQTSSGEGNYIGASEHTSNTGELTAQAHAAMFLLGTIGRCARKVPVAVVYDSEVAARLAMATATSKVNKELSVVVASLWQLCSMHVPIYWYHTYSHRGDALNEMADAIVAAMAYRPELRDEVKRPCSEWLGKMPMHNIKLIYLLYLPPELRHAYPMIREDKRAIEVTPASRV